MNKIARTRRFRRAGVVGARQAIQDVAVVRRLLLGFVCLGSCVRPSEPEHEVEAENYRCPQTYEFGNYGCPEIVGLLIGPDGELARAGIRFDKSRPGPNVDWWMHRSA
jgi:hypothetical protein